MLTPCRFSGFLYFRVPDNVDAAEVQRALEQTPLVQGDLNALIRRNTNTRIIGLSTQLPDARLRETAEQIRERFPGIPTKLISEQDVQRMLPVPDETTEEKGWKAKRHRPVTSQGRENETRTAVLSQLADQFHVKWPGRASRPRVIATA